MASLGFLQIKVFWNKVYDVILSAHDVINKILSSDSYYIVDLVIKPKFGNTSVTIWDVIRTSVL